MYLRPMVAGEWTGTMNLTEPQAGSDVGALTTRAVPTDDGVVADQRHEDLHHLRRAGPHRQHRPPRARPRARRAARHAGHQLLHRAEGARRSGERNAVRCIGIEHKMGIHASPDLHDGVRRRRRLARRRRAQPRACADVHDDEHRPPVGRAVGVWRSPSAPTRRRSSYATERVQGRAPDAPRVSRAHRRPPRRPADAAAHPQPHRGDAGLVYTNAWAIDVARHGARRGRARSRGQELADLLTPITKAWCTDLGSELTRLVHAGARRHGLHRARPASSSIERDIRIAAIYEGTNGIQAMDLVGRKLPMRGRRRRRRSSSLDRDRRRARRSPGGRSSPTPSPRCGRRPSGCWPRASRIPATPLAGATPYLRLFGTVLGGWFLARQAAAAGDGDPGPVATARYYCEQVLPTARGLVPAVTAGPDVLVTSTPDRTALVESRDRHRRLEPSAGGEEVEVALAPQGRQEAAVGVVAGEAVTADVSAGWRAGRARRRRRRTAAAGRTAAAWANTSG